MNFVNRLLDRFRSAKPGDDAVEQDIFNQRLIKMQGRAKSAPLHTPFKSPRLHPAA